MTSLSSLSKEQLESIVRFAEWSAIILTFLGAASGVVFILANRPLRRLEAAERQYEHDASQTKIAGAVAIAATANERTAKLELEAATQRERAATAERLLAEVNERTKERHLDDNQRNTLATLLPLAPRGSLRLKIPASDDEATKFSHELRQVLTAAGWSIDSMFVVNKRPIRGLILQWHGGSTPPDRVTALADAMRQCRLEVRVEQLNLTGNADIVDLVVGSK
jgi:hypothetical protein